MSSASVLTSAVPQPVDRAPPTDEAAMDYEEASSELEKARARAERLALEVSEEAVL